MPTPLPLVDLLGRLPADGALFTTFTLSLTWFEAYLLRPLERQGVCRVSILADPHGVDQSLRERLASGPGLRYSVSSVPRAGSFHPKVCLTWTASTLVLAVGSGNLTLPGMLRNLEVYELLVHGVPRTPASHALSREVADGLLQWLAELDGLLPSTDPARRTLEQARRAVRGLRRQLPSNPNLSWLDTFQGSIGEQLLARVGTAPEGPGSGGRALEVLSPFHDENGGAVRRLATGCGASKVTVLGTDSTPFPLSAARSWSMPVVGARLADETWHTGDSPRALHAKVVRLRDGEDSWLLSGSANLTHTGMWTQKNVEVSLLRRGAGSEWDDLLATGPGALLEVRDPPSEVQSRPLQVLSARAAGGHIEVMLHSSGRPTTVEVSLTGGGEPPRSLPWGDGQLRWPLPAHWRQRRPAAVQVVVSAELEGEVVVARGWLAQEDWLDASPRWRRASVAWGRLLGATAPGEEDAELLRMFASEHVRTMQSLGSMSGRRRSVSKGAGSGASTPRETTVPLEILLAREGVNPSGAAAGTAGSADTIRAVQRAMLAAFQRLSHPLESDSDDPDDLDGTGETRRSTPPGPDGAEPGPGGPPLPKPVREALAEFEHSFWTACSQLTEPPQQPELVLSYVGMVNQLSLRLRAKEGEPEVALWTCVDRMVRAVCCARPSMGAPPVLSLLRGASGEAPVEVLHLLAGQIAALHWRSGWESGWNGLAGEPLREALMTVQRSFPKGDTAVPTVPDALRRLVETEDQLEGVLGQLEKIPSPSLRPRWLAWARRQVEVRGKSVRALPDPPGEPLTRAERRLLELPRGKVYPTFPWIGVCPGCHVRLSHSVSRELAAHRPVSCSGICRGVLLPSEGV